NARRVIAINKRFAEISGLSEDALATSDQRAVVAAALRFVKAAEGMLSRVDALHETDVTLRDELELQNGAVIDWFSAPVRTPDGAKVGRVAFFRDVTAERQAHHQLEHAREAAE